MGAWQEGSVSSPAPLFPLCFLAATVPSYHTNFPVELPGHVWTELKLGATTNLSLTCGCQVLCLSNDETKAQAVCDTPLSGSRKPLSWNQHSPPRPVSPPACTPR